MADIGILRAAFAPMTRLWRRPSTVEGAGNAAGNEHDARSLFRDGLFKLRSGNRKAALAAFDQALASMPDLADAVMARAELLDACGRSDEARTEYERARRLWADAPARSADRRYVFRRRGHFAFETETYDLVRSNVRNKVLPHLAHGNALLARGNAAEALESYERALKVTPQSQETLALKGEALSMLGRYEDAIQIFDGVLAADPTAAETLNARGIARCALGRLADANDDWRLQLELLPQASSAARACVALRQGSHTIACHEFESAQAKDPGNPYWPLYRAAAGRLVRLPIEAAVATGDRRWPSLLLAFLVGQVGEDELLGQANTAERQAEAYFQMGVVAAGGNPALARRHWKEVIDRGAPSLIEYGAASNELARLAA